MRPEQILAFVAEQFPDGVPDLIFVLVDAAGQMILHRKREVAIQAWDQEVAEAQLWRAYKDSAVMTCIK